jgi:hypothetical protein
MQFMSYFMTYWASNIDRGNRGRDRMVIGTTCTEIGMYLSCIVALLLLEQTQRCYYWYHCVCSINWVQWYTDWCHISYFYVKCIIQGVATSNCLHFPTEFLLEEYIWLIIFKWRWFPLFEQQSFLSCPRVADRECSLDEAHTESMSVDHNVPC